MPIPGAAGSVLVTVHVAARSARNSTWAVVLGPGLNLPRPLAKADAVALIGEVSATRRDDDEMFGPIAVDALLILSTDGEIHSAVEEGKSCAAA